MEDYKKLYLEQKKQSFLLEMSLMQLRANVIDGEMATLEEQLKEYVSESEKSDTDKA
jgi:hypothetical protein